MNKLQAHMMATTKQQRFPPQPPSHQQQAPSNSQYMQIGNASIPLHIISSLSIFGNALQQIRDTTQKENILNHLLRNLTTTASSLVPQGVASTISNTINNIPIFSTVTPHFESIFKPSYVKPIPVTMSPPTIRGPTLVAPAEMEAQPTMVLPQRSVYNHAPAPQIPDIITPKPTKSSYSYGVPSVKQVHFLPTVPQTTGHSVRIKNLSPLQDASRFSYKTNTQSTTFPDKLYTVTAGKPTTYNFASTTEHSFHIFDNHLNAEFNKLKFLPMPKHKKQSVRIIEEMVATRTPHHNPSHSFFTIEDAVTALPPHYHKTPKFKGPPTHYHRFKPDSIQDEIYRLEGPTQVPQQVSTAYTVDNAPRVVATTTTTSTTTSSTTTSAPPIVTSPTIWPSTSNYMDSYPTQPPTVITRPRTKHRRKKPKPPQFVNFDQEMDTATSNLITNSWENTRNRHRIRGRPSADMFEDKPTESNIIIESTTDSPYRSTERVKFPSRHRFAENTTPSPRPVTTTEREEPDIPTTVTSTTTAANFNEETTVDEHVRHRQRFRYKVRSRPTIATTSTTPASSSTVDADWIRNSNDALTTDSSNSFDEHEDKMVLKLMNSVAAKGAATEAAPTTKEESTTITSVQSRFKPIVKFDTKNRPRFSVKDYRNRLNGTASTNSTSKTTGETSSTQSNLFRHRNKHNNHNINKDDPENKVTRRLPLTTAKPRSTLPQVPRRKTLPARLDNINKFRQSTSSTPPDEVPTTTPSMTIKLRNSFRNRDKTRVVDKAVSANTENDISQVDDDELVRSESNHYQPPPAAKTSDQLSEPVVEATVAVTERSHETSIMKIAKDDHSYRGRYTAVPTTPSSAMTDLSIMNTIDSESNLLQRVSDLTVTSGQSFNSVNTKHISRKIPNYFTIATEDPILPIEAFFPNVINKE